MNLNRTLLLFLDLGYVVSIPIRDLMNLNRPCGHSYLRPL